MHFEIIRKGQRINPLKAQVATGNDLAGRQLADFKNRMRQIDAMKEKIKKVEKKITLTPAPTDKPLDENKQKIADGIKNVSAVNQAVAQEMAVLGQASVVPDLTGEAIKGTVTQNAVEKAQQVQSTPDETIKTDMPEKTQPTVQETLQEAEEKIVGEASNDLKVKPVYPPRISASEARAHASPAAKNGRKIKVPTRKPKYAKR